MWWLVGWLVYLVPGHTVPSVLYILYGTITKKCLTCRWSTIQTSWHTYKNRILTNLYKLWKFDMILDRKDCHFFHVCINMKYCKMNTGNKVVTTASLTIKAITSYYNSRIFSAGTSAKLLNIIDECRRSTRVLSSKLEKKSAKLLDTTEENWEKGGDSIVFEEFLWLKRRSWECWL